MSQHDVKKWTGAGKGCRKMENDGSVVAIELHYEGFFKLNVTA